MNAQVPAVVERADRSVMAAGTPPLAIVPQSFEQAWRFAELITRSGMAPRGFEKPEACMVAILHGLELGLTPMASLQSIAVVNGRPTIWGDGAIGLVRGSGLCEWIEETVSGEGDAMEAVCKAKRRGDPRPSIGSFSVADARKAGLWAKAGPWQQYPRRMLTMRARAFAIRDGFADVLRGVSIREEQEDVERGRPPDPRPAAAARTPAARRAPPEPPADDASTVQEQAPGATAALAKGEVIVEPEDARVINWQAELKAYGDALHGVEAHEELAEVIEAHGAVFADAPAEIQGAARRLETDRREAIGEDIADQGEADPRETLLGEIRSEIVQGSRKVLAILADLGDRRPLLTDADVAALKRAEKDFAAQAGGGGR